MKARVYLAACAALLALTISTAAQGLPNFTGTWTLDVAKSDFGPITGPESVVMVIDHKEPTLKVNVTQKGQMGQASNDSVYTTDGKDNVNRVRSSAGEQDFTSTTKWSGKMLATKRTIDAQGMSVGIDETWELSPDGKVMTINRTLNTPQGAFNTKMVLNKK
jgi:hypothetical protein